MPIIELRELQDDNKTIYDHWKPINPDSVEAAYTAGVLICDEYEKPKEDSSEARGEMAKLVYAVMLGASDN